LNITSGSVLGPILVKELLTKGMNAVAIMVGDNKDLLSAKNTLNTLKTLGSIAKITDSALSLFYVNNSDEVGIEHERLENVNNRITGFIATLALFLSDVNLNIDRNDMRNFFNQKKYKTIQVPTGIYFIESVMGTVSPKEFCTITNTRTIVGNSEQKSPLTVNSLHDKTGIVVKDEVFDFFSMDNLPVTLTSSQGCLKVVTDVINNDIEILNKINNNIVADELEDSDSGLIL